jgi:hypothetical protein
MNDPEIDELERQLAGLPKAGPAPALREAVLADVRRELRASRWDRRLARAAALLLLVGITANGMLGTRSGRVAPSRSTAQSPRESLAQVANAVAEATDAQTGRQVARQLAAFAGWSVGGDEEAAIDAAARRPGQRERQNGKKG